jgi:hypothetical protein
MITKKVILSLLTISLIFIISCSKDEPTAPSPSPTGGITVVSPNGGESWLAGTSNTITWTSNISDDVKIELYKGGNIFYTIANSTSNAGNYLWTIPDTLHSGNDFKVKITSVLDSSITDYSDSGFVALGLVLSNDYTGFLQLRFTNTYPSFDETTQVDVDINKYGEVTFGSGTLSTAEMTTTDNQELYVTEHFNLILPDIILITAVKIILVLTRILLSMKI